MGGETPNTAKLLLYRFFGPQSDLPVILAVIVLPAFCCADVKTLVKGYDRQTTMRLVFNLDIQHLVSLCLPPIMTQDLYGANFLVQNTVGI